jgi:hypothetical protein
MPNDGKPVAIAERCELLQHEGEDDLYTLVIMTMETNDAVRSVVGEKGRIPDVVRDEDWSEVAGEVPRLWRSSGPCAVPVNMTGRPTREQAAGSAQTVKT